MSTSTIVQVAGKKVQLTNLEKYLWPGKINKAQLVNYYHEMAPVILPHLYNRPLVMKRYPNGINGDAFYQKECPDYTPEWIKTAAVEHSEKVINYIVCNDRGTLLWLANQGCIEMHSWLSRIENIECPDIAVMDLDPAAGASFKDVLEIALLVKGALEEFNLNSYPKTSGAAGLHIFIPIKPAYAFSTVAKALRYVAELIVKVHSKKATIERKVANRTGKVYLDYLQNGRGKTMAFQYSLRPFPGAPVSTPLDWEEIRSMKVKPGDFSMANIFTRLKKIGDIYRGVLSQSQSLDTILSLIEHK